MVDCLQSDSRPVDSIFCEDGSVRRDAGCLTANIPRCRLSDHAEYDIEICHPSGHSWCITRRYREFRALRDALHSAYNLPSDVTIPSRKLFNNLSRAFVCQRSRDLEAFLNRLLSHYTLPPAPLAAFIDWDRYDIHGITNSLARQLSEEGDAILSRNLLYSMQVYQLSAVNRRIISPVAPILFNDPCEDFGNVLDFLGNLEKLRLIGSIEKLHKSNVTINSLNFDMSPFKRLKYLELINVELKRMRGFEYIKSTMTELIVHHSLKNLRNLMLGDLYAAGGGDWVYGETPVSTLPWNQIKMADFSNNFLHSIDQTITLLPMVEILNLSNNLLTELAPLTCLPYLRVLYLSGNQLYIGEEAGLDLPTASSAGLPEPLQSADTTSLDAKDSSSGQQQAMVVMGTAASASTSGASEFSSETAARRIPPPPLHTRLGEIHVLALANNGLRSASLVAGLNSLQHLDLSNNKIDWFGELLCLGSLPHLSSVDLSGNPICGDPYYRRNTLDLLGLRFALIALDGHRATRLEIEIVELYRALKRGGVTLCSQPPAIRAQTVEEQKESAAKVSTAGQTDQPVSTGQCNHKVVSCNDTAMAHGDSGLSATLKAVDLPIEKEVPHPVCESEDLRETATVGQVDQPVSNCQCNHEVASCNQAAMAQDNAVLSATLTTVELSAKSEVPESFCQSVESRAMHTFQPNNNPQSSVSASPNPDCQVTGESLSFKKPLSPTEQTEKDQNTHSDEVADAVVTTGSIGVSPNEALQSTETPTVAASSNASAHDNCRSFENLSDTSSTHPDNHLDVEVATPPSSAQDNVASTKLQPQNPHVQGADTLPNENTNDLSPSDLSCYPACGAQTGTSGNPTTMSAENVDENAHC